MTQNNSKWQVILSFMLVLSLCSTAPAQQSEDKLLDKLSELREKKAVMTAEYKTQVHKLNLAADERMAKVKEEYRIARDAAIQNGREALEEMRKDYESRLKPLLKEEEEAIEALGHDVTDFAKTRFEKGRSR